VVGGGVGRRERMGCASAREDGRRRRRRAEDEEAGAAEELAEPPEWLGFIAGQRRGPNLRRRDERVHLGPGEPQAATLLVHRSRWVIARGRRRNASDKHAQQAGRRPVEPCVSRREMVLLFFLRWQRGNKKRDVAPRSGVEPWSAAHTNASGREAKMEVSDRPRRTEGRTLWGTAVASGLDRALSILMGISPLFNRDREHDRQSGPVPPPSSSTHVLD
jgi:hypothetical protein